MHKIRIPQSGSIILVLIFLFNISMSPLSLSVPDLNLQNQNGTIDAVQDPVLQSDPEQNSRFAYDAAAVANPRGFSKALANGIPTLTEWWSPDFDFRRMVNVTEPGITPRSQEPVTLNVNFPPDKAYNNSLRIAYYNSTGPIPTWVEVPSQVWQNSTFQGLYYDEATITFFVDSDKSQAQTYYLYYDDNDQGLPSGYNDNINATAADGPATNDRTGYGPFGGLPWVYNDVTGTNMTGVDTVYVATTANNTHAAILLTDDLRDGSDWGGPCGALITANYGDVDALETNNGTTNDQFFIMGDIAIDPDGLGDPMSDLPSNRANVAPNNPIEAWVPGAGVWITDDGPLFTRIKFVTSDGGYQDNTNFMSSPEGDETGQFVGSRSDRGSSGFVNYTFVYTFYYHGDNLFVNIEMDIMANPQRVNEHVFTKNYGDWPHLISLTCSGSLGPIDSLQGQKAWNGVLRGLYDEDSDQRRHDFPIEPWVAWYDNGTSGAGDMPGIGIVAKTNPTGWEVFSLAVSNMGDNLVLQQILREGHQGDFYMLPDDETLHYDYYVYTSDYGRDYLDIRDLSFKVNNPLEVSMGVEELYEHNILTVQTMASPHSWPTDSISNVNVTIQKTGYSDWGLTDANGEYQFTKVPDGTVSNGDPYNITSSYTIGATTYTVDVTTNYNINHSIDRAPTLQINCDLSRLQITATNADGGGALSDAMVRMRRAPPNQTQYIEGTTGAGGIVNFILYYPDPSTEDYAIEVEYPKGTPAVSVTPASITVPTVTSQSVSCVVTVHATTLKFVTPNQAFVSTVIGDSVTFTMEYWDLVESQSIDGATTANWTLKLGTTPVDNGVLTETLPGQYQKILDTSPLTAGQTYTLTFELDLDTPVDYAPATFVFSVAVNYISTQLFVSVPGQTWQAQSNTWVYLTLHYEETDTTPIADADVVEEPGTPFDLDVELLTTVTNGTGDVTARVRATSAGAFSVTFRANKTGYADGFTYFTLATGATPAHLKVTNSAGTEVSQATISIGQSYQLYLWYETTPSPGSGINATEGWDVEVTPSTGLSITPADIVEESPEGNYSITLTPTAAGTYTIIFTAHNGSYTDGVGFFTLLMGKIPATLSVSPGSANLYAGGTATFTLWYKTSGGTGIPGANIARSISPTGPSISVKDNGGGKYTASGEFGDPGTYTLRFTASKTNYTDGRDTAVLNVALRPSKLEISSPSAAEIIAEEMYPLNVTYTDTLNGQGITGGKVSVLVTPTTGMTYEDGVHLGDGRYQIALHGDSIGTYTVTVTLSHFPHRQASVNFFLTVKPIPTILNLLELQGTNLTTSIERPINDTFIVTLNFAQDRSPPGENKPVQNATLRLDGIDKWQVLDSSEDGTYIIEVDTTGSVLGIHPIWISASKENHAVGRTSFELQVRPFHTELLFWGETPTSVAIPVNEILDLELYYNNTDWGVPVSEAELVISGLPLTNNRTITWQHTEETTYLVTINTGVLPETRPFTLTITGRNPPVYADASVNFQLTIIPIPFRAQDRPLIPGQEPTLAQAISAEQDQEANVTIQLFDTYHNVPLEDAEVIWILYVPIPGALGISKAAAATISSTTVQIEEEKARGEFEYLGNGMYQAFIPSADLDPGEYRLEIQATKSLYEPLEYDMTFVVTPKPGTPTTYFLGLAVIILGSIGGFYSWFFYFRWPPQVRYIRKALKRLEAGSQVDEGRFLSKEDLHQTMVKEQLQLPRQLLE